MEGTEERRKQTRMQRHIVHHEDETLQKGMARIVLSVVLMAIIIFTVGGTLNSVSEFTQEEQVTLPYDDRH